MKESEEEINEMIEMVKIVNDFTSDKGVSVNLDEQLSPMQLRRKYRDIVNQAFTEVSVDQTYNLFTIVYALMEEFTMEPENVIQCLDKINREKLKNFADNNFNTIYFRKKEKERRLKRMGNPVEDIAQFFK